MKIRLLLSFVFLLFISGCTGLSDSYRSKSADSGGHYSDWANGAVKIQLKNSRIYIMPQNSKFSRDGVLIWPYIPLVGANKEFEQKYSKGAYLYSTEKTFYGGGYYNLPIEGDYFYVEVCMRADKENVAFNPREIYLQLESGEYIQASKYIIPNFKLTAPNPNWEHTIIKEGWNGRKLMPFEKDEQSKDQYFELPKGQWVGFAIRFETLTPNPGTLFSIEARGLTDSGEQMSIPTVTFKGKKIFRAIRT